MGRFDRLEKLMDFFAANTVPGCGCCIMENDEVLFEKYAGCSNLETGEKVNERTLFRQASTTKLFTYAIMGMLYEEGAFLFTDPIYEYLPEWKNVNKWIQTPNGFEIVPVEKPITIMDAATMRCGLPYCMVPDTSSTDPTFLAMSRQMERLNALESHTIRDEVRAMADVPLAFEPGTHWLYGFGSEIIGAVLEEITGKHVRELFVERVIEPLGLKDSLTYHDEESLKRIVTMYGKDKDGKFFRPQADFNAATDPKQTVPGARCSLLSSPHDFAVFMQMLANGGTYRGKRLLSAGTVEMLHTNCLNETQQKDFNCDYLAGYGYGYGFRTLIDKGAGSHNGPLGAFGWTGGFGTWAEADPVRKLSLVYMHNMAPNEEYYHHLRFRNTAYACIGDIE